MKENARCRDCHRNSEADTPHYSLETSLVKPVNNTRAELVMVGKIMLVNQ